MAEGEVRIKELEEVTTLTQNHYFVVDDSSSGGETKKYQADKVTAPLDNALLNEASSYDTTHTYNEGDYCLKDNVLYRCLYDNVTGTWTASKWVQTSLGADLTENTNDTQQAFVEGTASGTIATFHDGSNLPLKSLTADITAIQDLHGYDNPWVGGAGKNLLNFNLTDQTQNGVTIKKNSDGSFTLNGTANAVTIFQVNGVGITLDAGTYTFSGVSGGSASTSYWFELNNPTDTTPISKTFTNPTTFTLTENSSWRTVYFACRANTAFSNMTIKPMLELGSTATTFAPYSNICPISGWTECKPTVCGVNVWDEETKSGYWDVNNGNYMNVAGQLCSNGFVKVSPNMTLYGYKVSHTSYGELLFYDAEYNYIDYLRPIQWINKEFTIPNNCHYITFNLGSAYGTTYNNDISINYPSTDTSYHAYNGQTYTISLNGTRYGGKVDLVSGVLTVDKGYVDLGTLDWQYSSIGEIFYVRATDLGVKATDVSTPFNAISSALIAKSYNEIDAETVDYAIGINPNATQLFARYSSITSASDFITAMNGVQLVYELATPLTYSLTKQQIRSLVGKNNIFADTGDILDATYVRNANITINDLIRRIEALEG